MTFERKRQTSDAGAEPRAAVDALLEKTPQAVSARLVRWMEAEGVATLEGVALAVMDRAEINHWVSWGGSGGCAPRKQLALDARRGVTYPNETKPSTKRRRWPKCTPWSSRRRRRRRAARRP